MRRIVTAHSETVTPGKEPIVDLIINDEPNMTSMDGVDIKIATLWQTHGFPSSNQGREDEGTKGDDSKIVISDGSNLRYGELPPGAVVPMHRTASCDYNVFTRGRGVLLTPKVELDPKDIPTDLLNDPRVEKTPVKQGDVVVQRGTIHGWANDGDEPLVWIGVCLPAEPAKAGAEVLQDGFWL